MTDESTTPEHVPAVNLPTLKLLAGIEVVDEYCLACKRRTPTTAIVGVVFGVGCTICQCSVCGAFRDIFLDDDVEFLPEHEEPIDD